MADLLDDQRLMCTLESDKMTSQIRQTIGFIGAGQMARALAAGFLRAQLVGPKQIVAADPDQSARVQFSTAVNESRLVDSNAAVVESADIVFLAVKPQVTARAIRELADHVTPEKLFVSIAAGVALKSLAAQLGSQRVIRVMPNTPCLIGAGAAAFACAADVSREDARHVAQLLESVGIAFELDESLLDAVTGLSGSGPAFVYMMIEALSDGGVRGGLPRQVATALAAQTVRGAAEMVLSTGEHPAVLKDRVTSPGGTTITGVQALEAGAARASMISAVMAATERSRELGESEL